MKKELRIGIDFDNTIVSYDGLFYQIAREKGLIPSEILSSKKAVRDYLCSVNQEHVWTELQGYVYGARMDLAQPYPGVSQFLSLCQSKKIPAFIISHKTLHPFLGPRYDLHQAANQWLTKQSFSIPSFFELTLEKKLERIKTQNCTVFIDDLPEIFEEKIFPQDVFKILFDPHALHTTKVTTAQSWKEVTEILKYYNYVL